MAEPAAQSPDHNLAEMAQQLEAALRRASTPEGRPPVTDPLARQLGGTSGNLTARVPARELKARVEPRFEAKPETRVEAKAEPKFDTKPEPRESAATPGKNLYENLEEEMASLLNRAPGKS